MLGAKLLTTQPVRVCCSHDPAIDRELSNVNFYMVVRDESLVKALPGKAITWFHLRRLPRSVAADIEATASNRMVAQLLAFNLAVIRVENLHTDEGEIIDFVPLAHQSNGDRNPSQGLSRDEVNYFTTSERTDIGDVVLRRSDLRHGRQPFFPPLESSVRALGEAVFLSADESPEAVSLRHARSGSPSTTTPQAPSANGGTSGSRGGASAKAAAKSSARAKSTRGRTTAKRRASTSKT
jgi:hypothetical protein